MGKVTTPCIQQMKQLMEQFLEKTNILSYRLALPEISG
jgi:hypothetical protein